MTVGGCLAMAALYIMIFGCFVTPLMAALTVVSWGFVLGWWVVTVLALGAIRVSG